MEETTRSPGATEEEGGGAAVSRPPYAAFAALYDNFMGHVPYEHWARYLLSRARAILPVRPAAVLDLACGTGALLSRLRGHVEGLYGMDRSSAMLACARGRLPEGKWRRGRLEGPLPYGVGQFHWLVSTHDSLNYLTDSALLVRHFRAVGRVLAHGGLYSVDAVTESNVKSNHDGRRFDFESQGRRVTIARSYDARARMMVSRVRVLEGGAQFEEIHEQRCYELEDIVAAAAEAGLSLLALEGDYARRAPRKSDAHLNLHFTLAEPDAVQDPGDVTTQKASAPRTKKA